ncbi:hypothetical protein ACFW9L_33770 [Streptomyces sp. NPDC059517]|uniref:hypothetical protein n=1 Tax=Streptomyces sp. NPDC059517 TaxID=3346855 RepID=UPI00368B7941
MEWTALVSTLVGGGIATLSAGSLEFWRSKRQRVDQSTENRRVLYGSYLAVLSETRHTLGSLARARDMQSAERAAAVWDAYVQCISRRYEVEITAPTQVVAATENTHHAFRDLCVAVADGVTNDSDTYAQLRQAYKEAHALLRRAMRSDLGAEF